eukprot:gene36878-48103_t
MKSYLEGGFPLRCFQRLSRPYIATLRHSWQNDRGNSFQVSTPTADRDQTVSRRSEPSSRTTLIGEQPNPWDLLQPQDVMSRHRGAKRFRRYELLGIISLLSPALAVRQAYAIALNERFPTALSPPSHASVTLWEATAPVKLPAMRCLGPG